MMSDLEQFFGAPAGAFSDRPGETIHRLPPMIMGEEIYMANQLDDIVDWGLQGNKLQELWPDTQGEGVDVCIIDTGTPEHSDLPEPLFSHNFSRSQTPFDRQGHATHVAGTLGARKNGSGGVGVAPLVRIGYCKALGDDGSGGSGSISRSIYRGIEEKVHIISMSLGGGFDREIAQACMDAVQAGIFVICAAGNEGQQNGRNTVGWPARLPFTIAIASYNSDGKLSEFSSRGPEVDAAFPGEDIFSTWLDNKFRKISGTSMSTPFATGMTALMLEYQNKHDVASPVKNNADWKARVKETSEDRGPQGRDSGWGWGIPDPDGFIRGGAAAVEPGQEGSSRFNWGPLNVETPFTTADGRSGAFVWFDR